MIFNLFKSKPTLKELIPNGFVDIHSHILPGIDDGAKNMTESLELITGMKKLGFSKIIATPHTYPGLYENTSLSIKKAFKKIENFQIKNIKVDYASEYMLDKSIIDKARQKQLLCIKDNYVLIEIPFISMPLNTYEIIFEIITNEYIPVLAHPERYGYLANDFKHFFRLKQAGCLFQLNLFSLTGYYGRDIYSTAMKLLKFDLVDFIGSDIHKLNQLKIFENKILTSDILKIENLIEKTNIKFG